MKIIDRWSIDDYFQAPVSMLNGTRWNERLLEFAFNALHRIVIGKSSVADDLILF
jgi:hypothetical protein